MTAEEYEQLLKRVRERCQEYDKKVVSEGEEKVDVDFGSDSGYKYYIVYYDMQTGKTTYTPVDSIRESIKSRQSQEKLEGFEYVSEYEYRKLIFVPVVSMAGWSRDLSKPIHKKLTRIGGIYQHANYPINTKAFDEAIVLAWNGIPTVNGIRYKQSKSNRLEPRYNVMPGDNMDY